MAKHHALSTAALAILILGGAASAPCAQPAADVLKLLPGYLAKADRPDSLKLLPPPPAPGSADQARDEAAARVAMMLQGSPRWRMATSDADLEATRAVQIFDCALRVDLTPEQAPKLTTLLQRTLTDIGLSTYGAKLNYMRARPFTVDNGATCTPGSEKTLRGDGSYPSGHSAIGWGWALILAEIAPDRADAVLARGRAFGQSRVVCNVHWQSDVDEGRLVAAAVVAKLHGDRQFREDLDLARAELAALRKTGAPQDRDCAAEAASLGPLT